VKRLLTSENILQKQNLRSLMNHEIMGFLACKEKTGEAQAVKMYT